MAHALVLTHVIAATVALLAGGLSMLFRKGSGLHTVAGRAFVLSMILMTSSAIILASAVRPNAGNVLAGSLTLYLTVTGWATLQARTSAMRTMDCVMALAGVAVFIIAMMWGGEAAAGGGKDGYGPGLYLVFGAIAFLFAFGDVRMLLRCGVTGARRLARHLLRMGLALLMALLSFYPGQAKLFPAAWRDTNLLMLPHVVVLLLLVSWLVRLRRGRRGLDAKTPAPSAARVVAAPVSRGWLSRAG